MSGVIISQKATRALSILQSHYPQPLLPHTPLEPCINATSATKVSSPIIDLKQEFPTIFDGNIRMMEGEEFHITLTEHAKPFCVNAPQSVPFVYHDKLKAEFELLQHQQIIAPMRGHRMVRSYSCYAEEKLLMCVGLSYLNHFVVWERYQSITPAQALQPVIQKFLRLSML